VTSPAPNAAMRTRTRGWWLFVLLEVTAVLALPVLVVIGARALLDSRGGTFVAAPPGPTEPGYQALVDPSPVLAVVERLAGEVTGVTVLARSGIEVDGGAALLVPAELLVEGRTLRDWGAEGDRAVTDALGRALRLEVGEPVAVDEAGWGAVLGGGTVTVRNPDPVLVDGEERFGVGLIAIGADDAAEWLGLLGNQDPSALLFRRSLFWNALLDGPATSLTGDSSPVPTMRAVSAGVHAVVLLPVVLADGTVSLDPEAAEAAVVEVVPFPAGARPGDRLRVRVLDRTGSADLPGVARLVARAGGEVVMVGNARAFDGLPTEARIADPALDDATRRLLERLGAGTVTVSPGIDDVIDVTVLTGPDLVSRVSG
jgi:hypothetical protein